MGQSSGHSGAHCAYHCGARSGCGAHFTSLEAFDAHRAGDYSGVRYCLDPDDLDELVVKSNDGRCSMYAEDVERVVVWASARAVGRAQEAFSDVGVNAQRGVQAPELLETVM